MSSHKKYRISFLVPYPVGIAPGQRFRFEQYLSLLSEKSVSVRVFPFISEEVNNILYQRGFLFRKVLGVIRGFLMRFFQLFLLYRDDFVFLFREASPIGPPVFEWIIVKILRKKIIYDFDDSIWLTDKVDEGKLEKVIRWRSKVKSICRWSYKVSCGNDYLCEFARQFNDQVILNPTTIDTEHLHNPALFPKQVKDNRIVIGWTGSHSTLKYLTPLVPVIQLLEKKYPDLLFLVIANKKPEFNLRSLVFIPWSEDSEIIDLMKINIGVMPLPDDEWARGKCGFKALQYMALKIPTIASPVGVNKKIVDDGVSGYLCSSEQEWIMCLEKLIMNSQLRFSMGERARMVVETQYSVLSNFQNFFSLFSE